MSQLLLYASLLGLGFVLGMIVSHYLFNQIYRGFAKVLVNLKVVRLEYAHTAADVGDSEQALESRPSLDDIFEADLDEIDRLMEGIEPKAHGPH